MAPPIPPRWGRGTSPPAAPETKQLTTQQIQDIFYIYGRPGARAYRHLGVSDILKPESRDVMVSPHGSATAETTELGNPTSPATAADTKARPTTYGTARQAEGWLLQIE